MVSANGDIPHPDIDAVGHHQVGRLGTNAEENQGFRGILGVDLSLCIYIRQDVLDDKVECRQWSQLNKVYFDARLSKRLQSAVNGLSLHRE